MFCRKCGNQLADDAAFCSKCGAKVIDDSLPPPTAYDTPAAARSESAPQIWLSHPVVRFFLYLIIFVAITILLYSIILPPNLSLMKFITDPRGLLPTVGGYIGGALVVFVCFLPLLSRLAALDKIPEKYKLKAYFLILFLYELGSLTFGRDYFSEKVGIVSFAVLGLGILVRLFTSSKKKK